MGSIPILARRVAADVAPGLLLRPTPSEGSWHPCRHGHLDRPGLPTEMHTIDGAAPAEVLLSTVEWLGMQRDYDRARRSIERSRNVDHRAQGLAYAPSMSVASPA